MNNEVQPGEVLDRRFEVTELVKRSGMATIYKAKDRQTGQTIALKVPSMQCESDAGSFSRFEREEEICKRLNHPYVVKVISVEQPKSRPYIAMEYLEGQTLDLWMQEHRPLPESDAVRIATRICDALDHMHGLGVIHRDLKPQNILICDDGGMRIMDFGISKASRVRRITFVGFSPALGTPDYMAPEQVQGKRGDERTDIYSLGTILYEMTTGSVPFPGEDPSAIMNARLYGDPAAPRTLNPNITLALEEIILHAMEGDPANRYASAAAMKDELLDFSKVQLTGRHQNLKLPAVWKSNFRPLRLIAIVFALQIITFFLLYWYFTHKRSPGNSGQAPRPQSVIATQSSKT